MAKNPRKESEKPAIFAGASGFSFKEWKGEFYPAKIKPEEMLAFYSARLPTVEINSSYYAMTKAETLAKWAATVPDGFRFSLKAPKRITHDGKLMADKVADAVAHLFATLPSLGDRRGPVLFGLPPYHKLDLALLKDFLQLLPKDHRAAFEFRHDSWFCDAVYDALRDVGASLCLSEREDARPPPLIETAPWGYVRLRLESYSDAALKAWAKRLASTGFEQIHAYFMHEPTAPGYARRLIDLGD